MQPTASYSPIVLIHLCDVGAERAGMELLTAVNRVWLRYVEVANA